MCSNSTTQRRNQYVRRKSLSQLTTTRSSPSRSTEISSILISISARRRWERKFWHSTRPTTSKWVDPAVDMEAPSSTLNRLHRSSSNNMRSNNNISNSNTNSNSTNSSSSIGNLANSNSSNTSNNTTLNSSTCDNRDDLQSARSQTRWFWLTKRIDMLPKVLYLYR